MSTNTHTHLLSTSVIYTGMCGMNKGDRKRKNERSGRAHVSVRKNK